jgi:hypothetical protein
LKLFAGYPAMMADKTQIAAMTSVYLEKLAAFPEPIVAAACDQVGRINSPFPPSAGQVYSVCADLNAKRIASERAALPRPSEEKLEAPRIAQERWDELKRTLAEAALSSRMPQ